MRRDHEKFNLLETVVVAVGPENADAFRHYWEENDLPFIGLPDPRLSVLKLYGQEVKLFKLGRQPAQMIVDKEGTLRFTHYGHAMSDIPPNEEILDLLGNLQAGPG